MNKILLLSFAMFSVASLSFVSINSAYADSGRLYLGQLYCNADLDCMIAVVIDDNRNGMCDLKEVQSSLLVPLEKVHSFDWPQCFFVEESA